MNKRIVFFALLASLIAATFTLKSHFAKQRTDISQDPSTFSADRLSGLQNRVTVVRDEYGVPHVTASNDHDAYFMMGYLHAQDRFFEMDTARRMGDGTLAELLGAGPGDQVLDVDIQSRLFGIRRAAERSLRTYSPQVVALIKAYSDGVNASLDQNPLPPEYAALEITQARRWTPLDTVTVAKGFEFQLSFDLGDLDLTQIGDAYVGAGDVGGFEGGLLFLVDIFNIEPFAPVATLPPSSESMSSLSSKEMQLQNLKSRSIKQVSQLRKMASPELMGAVREFLKRTNRNPLLRGRKPGKGSNWWVVSGSKTGTGNTMLASDPHFGLTTPAPLYEIHLKVNSNSSPMNVYGVSYAGFPGVIMGQNGSIAFGASTSLFDVTDIYLEELVVDDGVPVATLFKGEPEPLVVIPQEFRINQIQNGVKDDITVISTGERPSGLNVPAAIRVVPRRNNGPLLMADSTAGISVQYTGFSPTHDLEGIFALARARNLDDFRQVMQLIEGSTLNWAYADVNGNIAYFTSGKVPLREDLEAGLQDVTAPFSVRDGTGALPNEWIPSGNKESGLGYQALPFEEMPQAVNPTQGFLVNANNDPIGTTFDGIPFEFHSSGRITYIGDRFATGLRAAKITNLLEQEFENHQGHGKISFKDMQRIQSNVQMFDAEVFTPYILTAFAGANSPGASPDLAVYANDPSIREAVSRLSNWDFSAPTGISGGYDASDITGRNQQPSNSEVSASVAATIYTVWRSQILANTIIATLERVGLGDFPDSERLLVDLRQQLDNFAIFQGVGASGLDFFQTPGIDEPPNVRRDIIILKSLKDALNLLASEAFADAFSGSTNQNDYRWGKLHRIIFGHLFGELAPQFSIPPAGNFENLSPALPGISIDGAFETVDTGPFDVLAASSQGYMTFFGAARRYVGELGRSGINSVEVIAGGESGVLGNRFYANQLPLWLKNDYHRILTTDAEINSNQFSRTQYKP